MINSRINQPFNKVLNVQFPERQAKAVIATNQTKGDSLAADFELFNVPSFVLLIGANEDFKGDANDRLTRLFNMGIVPAVVSSRSLVIDGGIRSGVSRLMGESAADREPEVTMIGFAPKEKVDYDSKDHHNLVPLEPHHSHFVLTPGDSWGAETRLMFELIESLTTGAAAESLINRLQWWNKSQHTRRSKGVCVVIGGDEVAKRELVRAVQMNLSIIVVSGSGGLADEIAAAVNDPARSASDAQLAQIVTDGELHFHQLGKPEKGMERLIIRELGMDSVLLQAWETYSDYDYNAKLQKRQHLQIQLTTILLGIFSATLAVYWQTAGYNHAKSYTGWGMVLHTLLILGPILTTLMLAAANKFKAGTKGLYLRAGAESLKREIYSYRTQAGEYHENAEQVLALRMENITRRTMRTEVNLSSVKPFNGFPTAFHSNDDGFSLLNPDKYIQYRLKDRLSYYRSKSVKIDKKLRLLYWFSFITAGTSTFLSVTEHQVWIAVTTAVVTAIGTYLALTQYETSLSKFNQGKTDLLNVMAWWQALSAEEQAHPDNFTALVEHTELIIRNEFDGWIQQMENPLSQLKRDQRKGDYNYQSYIAAPTFNVPLQAVEQPKILQNGNGHASNGHSANGHSGKNGTAKLHKNGHTNLGDQNSLL